MGKSYSDIVSDNVLSYDHTMLCIKNITPQSKLLQLRGGRGPRRGCGGEMWQVRHRILFRGDFGGILLFLIFHVFVVFFCYFIFLGDSWDN